MEVVSSTCSEKACVSLAEVMSWKSAGNLISSIRKSHDICEAYPWDSLDQEEIDLRATHKIK